jgi:hypothetical protein
MCNIGALFNINFSVDSEKEEFNALTVTGNQQDR